MTHMASFRSARKPRTAHEDRRDAAGGGAPKHGIERIPIKRSYAEGLTAAEYWATVPEVRANNVATVVSVSEPGEMAKVLVNNMIGTTVTRPDCGTKTACTCASTTATFWTGTHKTAGALHGIRL
jgi:DNA-directed RNA polymerase beta' subunit